MRSRRSLSVICPLFFFSDPTTTEIYTLSLHDALPIWSAASRRSACLEPAPREAERAHRVRRGRSASAEASRHALRSEEHTSELQSRFDLVCRLLLEKKKNGRWGDAKHSAHV